MDNIQTLPIEHFSYSAVREYYTNRMAFFKRRILQEYPNTSPYAMLRGDIVHQWIAQYLMGLSQPEDDIKAFIESIIIDKETNKPIVYGKTQSREGLLKECEFTIKNYVKYRAREYFGEIAKSKEGTEAIELSILTQPQNLELPLKVILDLVSIKDGLIIARDHKVVRSAEGQEDETEILLQAGAIAYATKEVTGKFPDKIIFDKIPVLSSEKTQKEVIEYGIGDINLAISIFNKYAKQMIKELHIFGDDPEFYLPNPYDTLNKDIFSEWASQQQEEMDREANIL
jgi:hypothetical protein